MFGQATQFYPTDAKTRRIMVGHIKQRIRRGTRVLDPSAGKGDLLAPYTFQDAKLYAIEIDPDLRYTLQGKKGITVIGSDFMDFSEPIKFDVVIMNPPFRTAAAHINKAWQLVADGGELVALCNTETVNNLCDRNRELLADTIKAYGYTENLGEIFNTGHVERVAKVDVTLIYLKKPESTFTFDFGAGNFEFDEAQSKEFRQNPLAHTDKIKNLVAKYKAAELVLVKRYEAQTELKFYLKGVDCPLMDQEFEYEARDCLSIKQDLTEQLAVLKSRFWHTLFSRVELGQRMTSGFRDKFSEYASIQGYLEFSEKNINEMLLLFFQNREQIMLDCIIEVFDKATAYHENNKVHHEGWKTNKGWKINNRIILPYGIRHDWGYFTMPYNDTEKFYSDMDKILCHLTGSDFTELSKTETIAGAIRSFIKTNGNDYQHFFESKFFRLRIHKKGTVWLDFKDPYLLDDFNHMAAKGKNWLGGQGF